jgi:hypothetical protein
MPRQKTPEEIARVDLRLPQPLRDRIAQLAQQENRSINAMIVQLLKEALNRTRIKRES